MSNDHSTASKRCCDCQIVKPLTAFMAENRNRDGRQGRCRACLSLYWRQRAARGAHRRAATPKACTKCGIVKEPGEFSPNVNNGDGLQGTCKDCCNATIRAKGATAEGRKQIGGWEKRSKLKHRYGLTLAHYNALVNAQSGTCAICGQPPKGGAKSSRLHVDHDHETGAIRGLLCHRCNQALGQFGDNLPGLMRAVHYLKRRPPRLP